MQEGPMRRIPHPDDTAMRKEVLGTLKANPAATYEIVWRNWSGRHRGTMSHVAAARLAAIYADQRSIQAARAAMHQPTAWWRFW